MSNKTFSETEQLVIVFLYQVLNGGHHAPCTVVELKAVAEHIDELIEQFGEEVEIRHLITETIRLINSDELPGLLK